MHRNRLLPAPPARFSASLADVFLALNAKRALVVKKLSHRVVIITSIKYLRIHLLHKT
jgi:hypothetical protein